MNENPLKKLESLGQSIWLDYIRRDLITNGELQHLIDEDGLRGMTSNPSIFEKAIAESTIYDSVIQKMALDGKDVNTIYEAISQQDVQSAANVFKTLYEKTAGEDGYVSLEVNPHLAHDTAGTIEEGRRLWVTLNRPNVLIKKGAHVQRLLWASTSNKNPNYSDIKYIEPLIGANAVNTVPPQTIDAYRDHGDPKLTIEQDLQKANRVLKSLPELGIDINKITQQLEDEGIGKFNEPFDKLMEALANKSVT